MIEKISFPNLKLSKKAIGLILASLVLILGLIAWSTQLGHSTFTRSLGSSLYVTRNTPFKTRFGTWKNPGQIVFAKDNSSLSINLPSQNLNWQKQGDTLTATQGSQTYTYSLLKNKNQQVIGLKEEIILQKRPPYHEFTFPLNLEDLTPKLKKGLWYFYDKNNNPLFFIPQPFMEDADGAKSQDVDIVIRGNQLKIVADPQWLNSPNRVYPIRIDPSLELTILDVHSSPQKGEHWIVGFETVGQDDLKIIPKDQATIDDLDFVSLKCGDQEREPQILEDDVIYYPNWQCDQEGQVDHLVNTAGDHTLIFQFGDQTENAYNSTGNYFGDESDGSAHFTTNTSFSNTEDGDYVVKEYSSLTIDSGVTVTTQNRAKGLFIYVTGDATINGTLSMTARGANTSDPSTEGVSSTGLRLPLFKSGETDTLSDADFSGTGTDVQNAVSNQSGIDGDGKIYKIERYGSSGGSGANGNSSSAANGGDGTGGETSKLGGGGGGGSSRYGGLAGDGGQASTFSGGSGAGGATVKDSDDHSSATAPGDWGGAGGDGAEDGSVNDSAYGATGGAGNAGGSAADGDGDSGEDGTGGVIWLIVGGDLTIGSGGVIEAEGKDGGDDGGSNTYSTGCGAGSGGGLIYALYAGSLTNNGSVSVAGGTGGHDPDEISGDGGDGGAGYSLIEQVEAGNSFPTAPTSLQTESQTNPTGVVDTTPEFSAIGNDPDSGDTLTHYDIEVDDDSDFSSPIWHPGKTDITDFTEGNRSSDISYTGASLDQGTTYYWRIKFWDDSGDEGTWSTETATFSLNQSPPAPTFEDDYLHDKIKTADSTPQIRFSSTDPDGDDITYQVEYDTDSDFSSSTTKTSDTDGGFSNVDNGSDTDPFTSGDTISYTFPTLSNDTTYFYRVRAKDPSGSNSWSRAIIAEAGTFTTSDGTWVTVNFKNSYTNPVVVGTTNTHNGEAALIFEAKNVTSSSADMRVCESEGGTSDGCDTHSSETVGYLVVDADQTDSISGIEAGTFNIDSDLDTRTKTISYTDSYSSAPIVLESIQTTNGDLPIETRITSTSTTSFTGGLCHQDGTDSCDSSHIAETFGWVAIEPGNEPFNETTEANSSGDVISNSTWTSQTFTPSFADPPILIVSTITNDGGQDCSIDEARSITSSGADVRYCELESGDTCDSHTSENVAWFAAEEGSLTANVWSDIQSFTIDTSQGGDRWFETHADQFSTDSLQGTQVNDTGHYVETTSSGNPSTWYDLSWDYRQPATISYSGSELSNYDVLIEMDTASLITAGKMQSDCDDLRITDSDGTSSLSYWIEGGCNSSSTQIWTQVPTIPDGGKDIYAYYGNGSASNTELPWSSNFILLNDTACPTGWSRNTTFDLSFPYGASSYGGTGGSSSHNHSDWVGSTTSVGGTTRDSGSQTHGKGHGHSVTITFNATTAWPPYLDMYYCQASDLAINSGLIGLFDTSAPSGWTRFSALDDNFPRGNSSYGGTGGSTTHTHTTNSATTDTRSNSGDCLGGGCTGSEVSHSHNVSADTTGTGDHTPPYLDMVFAEIDSAGYGEADLITMATELPPLGWSRFSALDSKFPRGASSYGGTGGSSSHSHTGSVGTDNSGQTSNLVCTGSGVTNILGGAHNHTVNYTAADTSHLPPYVETLFIQRDDPAASTSLGSEEEAPSYILSTPITIDDINDGGWGGVFFDDDETNGSITYQIYYDDNGTPTIVPDSDLSGNSTGWGTSPIDITSLSNNSYSTLYLYADLTYSGGSPLLNDWTLVPGLTAPSVCVIEESRIDDQNIFTWQDNEDDEDNIEVQRSTNGGAWSSLQTLAASVTTYTDTAISQGNQYQYRVATLFSEDENFYSDWCYTVNLSIYSGSFKFEGLKMEGLKLD